MQCARRRLAIHGYPFRSGRAHHSRSPIPTMSLQIHGQVICTVLRMTVRTAEHMADPRYPIRLRLRRRVRQKVRCHVQERRPWVVTTPSSAGHYRPGGHLGRQRRPTNFAAIGNSGALHVTHLFSRSRFASNCDPSTYPNIRRTWLVHRNIHQEIETISLPVERIGNWPTVSTGKYTANHPFRAVPDR